MLCGTMEEWIYHKEMVHIPVMAKEVSSILLPVIKEGAGVIIDGTVGTGGHLSSLLSKSFPGVKFLGIDIDPEAVKFCQGRFKGEENVIIRQGSYTDLPEIVAELNLYPVIGILLDFGLSRFQLASGERGFSFQREAPLDMRFAQEGRTARDLIQKANLQELEKILRDYGEERNYRRIARAILEKRNEIKTTFDLREVIVRAVGREDKRQWQRVFQALRIAVNRELENVGRGIERSISLLTKGGRIVVISYHSLEDRLVKQIFQKKRENGEIALITRKPIRPSLAEIRENPSSRSAKLRAAKKEWFFGQQKIGR